FDRSFDESNVATLEALISDVPDTCILVFVYSAVAFKPDKRRKFWKNLEKLARIVEFKYQTESALTAWVERHFAAEGKRVSRSTASFLVRYAGRSMRVLGGEIAKIAAFADSPEVTEFDVRAVTPPKLESAVFECAESLVRGELDSAAARFAVLLEIHKDELRDQAIPLIAALSWKLRREYQSRLKYGRRSPMLDWSADAVLQCAEADVRCKSSGGDLRAVLMDLFTLLLARRAIIR
ncbi:MAG: hypothetical protein LBC65_03925, partial [Oscillospiraceae bacterium]|nr:hypothetical protein [Oscillospiraceae bacterium]